MTYDELSTFGRLRKVQRCGPYSMFTKLIHMWKDLYSVAQVSHNTHYLTLTTRLNQWEWLVFGLMYVRTYLLPPCNWSPYILKSGRFSIQDTSLYLDGKSPCILTLLYSGHLSLC